MENHHYSVEAKQAYLITGTSCENGECTKCNHGMCMEKLSPTYRQRARERCKHFNADKPGRNISIVKGQSCSNCRYEREGCRAWKSWNSKKNHIGHSCRTWQREIE